MLVAINSYLIGSDPASYKGYSWPFAVHHIAENFSL